MGVRSFRLFACRIKGNIYCYNMLTDFLILDYVKNGKTAQTAISIFLHVKSWK